MTTSSGAGVGYVDTLADPAGCKRDLPYLTALGSTRIVSLMQSVWNEMRLAFHVVARPDAFHGSYLARNHTILAALADEGGAAAAAMLRAYLDEAEAQVLDAYRSRGFG